MESLADIIGDEALRNRTFPTTEECIFLGHAGVGPLTRVAADAMREFIDHAERREQENAWTNGKMAAARETAGKLIGATEEEISLLGPTSVGLSLVANGLAWEPGDEVVYYADDYPANVYPWTCLAGRGVKAVRVETEYPGVITWEHVEAALTERTRLVALASCNFLSGFRIDVDLIGRNLQERDILFSLDAIQTLGAFPTTVEHVDFLSADSHKWMLGPATAGIFYVDKNRRELLTPTLVGSWNVHSPDYVAQESIRYHADGRRYEPGMLNIPGIIGMLASMELLVGFGIETIGERLLELRRALLDAVRPLGYQLYIEEYDLDSATTDSNRSAIVTVTHPARDMEALFGQLCLENVIASLRKNRAGQSFIRFSPHCYNTLAEIGRVAEILA